MKAKRIWGWVSGKVRGLRAGMHLPVVHLLVLWLLLWAAPLEAAQVTHVYDNDSRLTKTAIDDGTYQTIIQYTFDDAGNLTSVSTQVAPADSDGDGMPNTWEVQYGLNPQVNDALQDSDADGLSNLKEFQNDTNPKVKDSDNDGIPDGWEVLYGLDPLNNDAGEDPDSDDLTNAEECQSATNPKNSDTDGDGMPDGWEVDYSLNPLVDDARGDADNDGFSNIAEYEMGTNPVEGNGSFYFIPKKGGGGVIVYF